MRYLGIDYGTKKIGLALSDENGVMAFPREVIPNDGEVLKTIEKLVAKEKVGEMVIGYSLDRDGKPNKVHEAVEALMLDITLSLGIPVHLEPEQYTTQEAMRIQGKTKHTDASAAALILNSFLTKNKNGTLITKS